MVANLLVRSLLSAPISGMVVFTGGNAGSVNDEVLLASGIHKHERTHNSKEGWVFFFISFFSIQALLLRTFLLLQALRASSVGVVQGGYDVQLQLQ